jgi:hypothetical protein
MGSYFGSMTHSQIVDTARKSFEKIPGHQRGYVTLEEWLDSSRGWFPRSADVERLDKTVVIFFKFSN